MNENAYPPFHNAPIPSPEAQTCRACGSAIPDSHAKYCPRCGAILQNETRTVSGLKIFGAICLGLVALVFGGAGACFLLFSGVAGGSPDGQLLGIALGCLLAAALCLWGFVSLIKRR